MSDNKKPGHRTRNPKDKAQNNKSLKLRDSQVEKIKDMPYGYFSSLMSELFDEHHKNLDFKRAAPSMMLNHDDIACIIGRGIDRSKALDCLVSWIENDPLPQIEISDMSLELYNIFFDRHRLEEPFNKLINHCFETVDYVSLCCFWDRVSFLIAEGLIFQVQNSDGIHNDYVKWATDSKSHLENNDSSNLRNVVYFSNEVRFAIYTCWRYSILLRRPTKSDSLKKAEWHLFRRDDAD